MTRPPRPRATAIAVIAAALAGVLAAPAAVAQEQAVVRVAANTFEPFEVAVEPGGTVTWLVQEGGHTIVADDRRFVLRGSGGGSIPANTTVTAVVGTTAEYIDYHCEIHGGPGRLGMSGRIRVGDPPRPPAAETPVIRVPGDRPDLASALEVAAPGHRIELAPGEHGLAAPVVIATDDLTIAGVGDGPHDVRLVPRPGQRGFPDAGLHVTGARVRIERLSLAGFRTAGIHLDGAVAAAVADVAVDGASFTLDGILAEQVTGLTVVRTSTVGARRAGIHLRDCAACGAWLRDVRSEDNLVGILADAAAGVLVERAFASGNAAGVVARNGVAAGAPLRGASLHIRHSELRDNTNPERLAGARAEDRTLGSGAGVWLVGPRDGVVADNDVTGHAYGIAVAGSPATTTRVTGNRLGGNADGDLAWDGAGSGVCFTGNTGAGGALTSEPPGIETLYPCDRPTVGVPFPLVLLRLLLHTLT